MRINLTVEFTEDFKNFLITHGQRAAWVFAAGVLSAVLIGFMLVFPSAAATLVCLLLVGWFAWMLSVLHAPATFPRYEYESLYSKVDHLSRQTAEQAQVIRTQEDKMAADAAIFKLAMQAKDVEYKAAMEEQARQAEIAQVQAFTHTVDEVNAAVDKILAATGRAPYAMEAAENKINPTKIATEDEINASLGLNPATAHLAQPFPQTKPKRVRKPTPSQARRAREAAANG